MFALEAVERVARHTLSSAGTDSPYDQRVALYRTEIRLYLRLLALHLAWQIGSIPPPDVPADDRTLQTTIAVGLDQIGGLFSQERNDLPVSPLDLQEPSPLPRRGGGARGGGTPLDLLARDTVLNNPSLLWGLVATARDAANSELSPGATLSRAYETFLAHAPSDAPTFSLQRSAEQAKRQGSYYTRPALARAVVEGALLPIRDRLSANNYSLRLLDPSMGSGVFLLEAVQALVRAGVGTAAQVAEACIVGFDVDSIAVDVAVLSLWLETGARPHILARNLQRCDAVRDDPDRLPVRFDVVVGNPPWGAQFTSADRRAMREQGRLPCSDSFDSFKLFLEMAVERSTGSIGMILPRAFLNGAMHAGTRGLLLRRFAPYAVHTLDAAEFPLAVAPACSLIFGPKSGPQFIAHHAAVGRNRAVPREHRIPARLWTRDRFPLGDGALLDLLDRLRRNHPPLGQIAQLYRVRDAGINYNRASIGRRILYEGASPEHPSDLPRYRGRNFTRYSRVHQGGWIRHDAHLRLQGGERLYLSRDTYDLPEKIVFRQTADRIIATLDCSRMAMGRSVIAVVAVGTASLLPLLACLNSQLFTCLYRALAGEEGRVLPQVKVKTISLLPLPGACLEGSSNRAWVQLGENARRRLAEPGDCVELDGEIDRAVYALFGMSAAEIVPLEASSDRNFQEY